MVIVSSTGVKLVTEAHLRATYEDVSTCSECEGRRPGRWGPELMKTLSTSVQFLLCVLTPEGQGQLPCVCLHDFPVHSGWEPK